MSQRDNSAFLLKPHDELIRLAFRKSGVKNLNSRKPGFSTAMVNLKTAMAINKKKQYVKKPRALKKSKSKLREVVTLTGKKGKKNSSKLSKSHTGIKSSRASTTGKTSIKRTQRKYQVNNRSKLLKKTTKKARNNILKLEAQRRINNLETFREVMTNNNQSGNNHSGMNNLERRFAALKKGYTNSEGLSMNELNAVNQQNPLPFEINYTILTNIIKGLQPFLKKYHSNLEIRFVKKNTMAPVKNIEGFLQKKQKLKIEDPNMFIYLFDTKEDKVVSFGYYTISQLDDKNGLCFSYNWTSEEYRRKSYNILVRLIGIKYAHEKELDIVYTVPFEGAHSKPLVEKLHFTCAPDNSYCSLSLESKEEFPSYEKKIIQIIEKKWKK